MPWRTRPRDRDGRFWKQRLFNSIEKKLYRALSNLKINIKQEEGFVGSSAQDVEVGKSGIVVLGGKEKEKERK